MSKEFYSGATWIYETDITNGSGSGGTIATEIVPGVGNEFEVLYGVIENDDGSTRTGFVTIEDDEDNIISRLFAATVGAAAIQAIPTLPTGALSRPIISGTQVLRMELQAVGSVQDAKFGLGLRIRGGVPTATESGQDTPTIVINKEQVF